MSESSYGLYRSFVLVSVAAGLGVSALQFHTSPPIVEEVSCFYGGLDGAVQLPESAAVLDASQVGKLFGYVQRGVVYS